MVCNTHMNADSKVPQQNLSIINVFSSLCYCNSSVELDLTDKVALPMCVSEPWEFMNLSPVHPLFFPGPFLVGTDHCTPGTLVKTSCIGDDLIQLSGYQNLTLVKVVEVLTLTHCSCFQHNSFNIQHITCCLVYFIIKVSRFICKLVFNVISSQHIRCNIISCD